MHFPLKIFDTVIFVSYLNSMVCNKFKNIFVETPYEYGVNTAFINTYK